MIKLCTGVESVKNYLFQYKLLYRNETGTNDYYLLQFDALKKFS